MCENLERIKAKEFIGTKVVAEKDDKYFSVATGIEYVDGERVNVPKIQRRHSSWFVETILTKVDPAYNKDMVGRTAVFVDPKAATLLVKDTEGRSTDESYKIKAVPAKVSYGLMKGVYGGNEVIAGKKITFKDLS